jgi:hypothetical protein
MKIEWILALLELGGIFIALVKAILMIGKVLKTVENHDDDIRDHQGRLETIESFLMGAHK